MLKSYGCPVEFSLDVLGGKWKPMILARLKQGPMRYGELRRMIPNLSDKMLSQRLRELAELGFIAEQVDGSYALTERGMALSPLLQALYDWGAAAAPDYGAVIRTSPGPSQSNS